MNGVIIARERFQDITSELPALLLRHWEELGSTKSVSPLDVEPNVYVALENAGSLMILTVRHEGALIGYAAYFVRDHPHYRRTKWAVSDVYYVAPEHRGKALGWRLFQRVEQELRAMGVKVMFTTGKVAHPQAQRLLLAMGHRTDEWGVCKELTPPNDS